MYSAIFGMVTNKQTNEQPGDPSASLLLTSEKAVFSNLLDLFISLASRKLRHMSGGNSLQLAEVYIVDQILHSI